MRFLTASGSYDRGAIWRAAHRAASASPLGHALAFGPQLRRYWRMAREERRVSRPAPTLPHYRAPTILIMGPAPIDAREVADTFELWAAMGRAAR